jgi:hypothetical protein
MLVREGISQPGNKVRVASTRAIQGEQAPFVIISFTRNIKGEPLKLGLVSDKHSLNVSMSRPEEFLLCTGNFKAWAQARAEGVGLLRNKNGDFAKFAQTLSSFVDKKDIISQGDWHKFINGGWITEAEFPKLIEQPKGKAKAKAKANQQQGPRPGQDGPAPRHDQYQVYDKKEEDAKKKASKARRSNKKKKPGDAQDPPPPPPPPGAGAAGIIPPVA